MLKIGSHVRDGDRSGEVVNYHARGYTVRDESGKFFVLPRERAKRKNRPRLANGTPVWLAVEDVDRPVPALYLGEGKFIGVDDPVWAGCPLDDREAKVIGVRT